MAATARTFTRRTSFRLAKDAVFRWTPPATSSCVKAITVSSGASASSGCRETDRAMKLQASSSKPQAILKLPAPETGAARPGLGLVAWSFFEAWDLRLAILFHALSLPHVRLH